MLTALVGLAAILGLFTIGVGLAYLEHRHHLKVARKPVRVWPS